MGQVLLNPFLRGSGVPSLTDTMVSRLTGMGAEIEDEQALRQWMASNYRADQGWLLAVTNEDEISLHLRVLAEGDDLAVWWGDGTWEIFTPAVYSSITSDASSYTLSHSYSQEGLKAVLIFGNLARLSMGTQGYHLKTRAENLPRTLLYLFLGSRAELSGNVLDLPPSLNNLTLLSQGLITGAVSTLPPSLVTLQLLAGSELTGLFSELPRGLEILMLVGEDQVTGAVTDLPPNLVRLSIAGSSALSGAAADLPRSVTYLRLSDLSTVAGDFGDLPEGLTYLVATAPLGALSGAAADLPPLLTHLQLSGGNYVTGQTADLPQGLTFLSSAGELSDLNGDVANLPAGLTRLYISGVGVLTGDIGDIPSGMLNLNLYDENTLTGVVEDLPTGLKVIDLRGNHTVGGDISGLPSTLESFSYSKYQLTPLLSSSTGLVPAALSNLYLYTALTQASVDNILAGFWAQRDEPKPSSARTIKLDALSDNYISPPTDLTVVEQLQAYRSPGNSSAYPLWNVQVNPPSAGEPEPEPLDIVIEKAAKSALSYTNRTVHSLAYDFASETQDGTVMVLLFAWGDQGYEVMTVVPGTLIVETDALDGGKIWAGYYVPTQADLDNGKTFTFETETTEVFQVGVVELSNVDLEDVAGPASGAINDSSNVDRQTAGGHTLTAARAGDLLVSASSTDGATTTAPTLNPDQGFTSILSDDSPGSAAASFQLAGRIAPSSGDYTTPTFDMPAPDEQNLVSFVIKAAEGEGETPPPPDPSDATLTAFTSHDPTYVTGTSATPPLPTTEVGDTVFAVVMHRSALTPPSGWDQVESVPHVNTPYGQVLSVYSRVFTGAESAYTWQQAESGRLGVSYVVVRSTSGELVIQQRISAYSEATGSPYDHQVPAVTTTEPNSLLLAISSCTHSPTSAPGLYEEPDGWTALAPTAQQDNRMMLALLAVAEPGVVTGDAFTHYYVSAHNGVELLLVLAPQGEAAEPSTFMSFEAEDLL